MDLQTALVWLVDFVIVATVVEFFLLWVLHAKKRIGVAPKDYALNLFSGVCLMLALRLALSEGPLVLILITLGAAGLLHGTDMARRWQR